MSLSSLAQRLSLTIYRRTAGTAWNNTQDGTWAQSSTCLGQIDETVGTIQDQNGKYTKVIENRLYVLYGVDIKEGDRVKDSNDISWDVITVSNTASRNKFLTCNIRKTQEQWST